VKAAESPTVVAFRALVMLACLIFVPLAAIFGSACPDTVRSLLIEPLLGPQFCPAGGHNGPGSGAHSSGPAGGSANLEAAPAWPSATVSLGAQAGDGSATGNNHVGPAGNLQPAGLFANPGQSTAQGTLARFDQPADPQAAPAWPNAGGFGNTPPIASSPGDSHANAPRPLPTTPPSAGPDHFKQLERRLREYGAVYYLLETWGNDGELYRFHCKMAIANNPNLTRQFEATHREALQAMTQVLEQIEAWRAGRLP
jgi:hypothetical protein